MKITFNENKQAFTPFEFTVKVETLEEAKAWYAIFNYTPNTNLLGIEGSKASSIREELRDNAGEAVYVCVGHREIANGVTYDQYYK